MHAYLTYKRYINELLKNQNETSIPLLQDIYSAKDYERILKPVLDTIRENPHASLTTLRLKLFLNSGLKEIMDIFVNDTKITPGVLLDFGTFKTRDTVLCGLRQEVTIKDGKIVKEELPIEQDTIFDLASSSKTFTTVAILALEEAGLIDVFDSIEKYVPEFNKLNGVSIYDLLKFRVRIVTDKRVDSAKNKDEALQILYSAHLDENQNVTNAYTDMGAMILRIVVERVSKMTFDEFVNEIIFKKAKMEDTHLIVPKHKLERVANENLSTIVFKDGSYKINYANIPGTPHDPKAIAIGELDGIAPGHAGYFSTKNDMIKFAKALINEEIISRESLFSISNTETGFKDDDKYTRFYGSLVYLKQPDPAFLSVYPPLSGKSFMSPGFAGTQLVVDPLNKITLFVGSPRLHNRIYQIHPDQIPNIKIDNHNMKTYTLANGEEKIVCNDYTKAKEVMVTLALDLAIQYQLLEKIFKNEKEMHLVRELN